MSTFISKLFVFVAAILVSCVLLYSVPTKYTHDLTIIINKLELLKQSTNNKIIFVGGSGLLVGLDSKRIADRFKYDVVNLGTFANFGINFLLEETKPYLKTGDIVIISPEYGLLFADNYFWPAEPHGITWALAFSPYNSFRYIYTKKEHFEKLPRDLSALYRDKLATLATHLFHGNFQAVLGRGRIAHAQIIDGYGDQIVDNFPRLAADKMEGHGIQFHGKITDDSKFKDLNRYNLFAKNKGVHVYFTFSCFPAEEYARNKEPFATAYQQLKNRLTFPVLGTPEDFIYPSTYFSNSINHLTREGRILRTDKVISLLSQSALKK